MFRRSEGGGRVYLGFGQRQTKGGLGEFGFWGWRSNRSTAQNFQTNIQVIFSILSISSFSRHLMDSPMNPLRFFRPLRTTGSRGTRVGGLRPGTRSETLHGSKDWERARHTAGTRVRGLECGVRNLGAEAGCFSRFAHTQGCRRRRTTRTRCARARRGSSRVRAAPTFGSRRPSSAGTTAPRATTVMT